jgi:hypothetical protein
LTAAARWRRRRTTRSGRVLLLAVALAAGGTAVVAAIPRPGTALEVAMTAATVPEDIRATLLAKARARGRLPVLIGLTGASPGAVEAARARLLADLGVTAGPDGSLAGPGISNVKLFETIPYLALTAEPAALERLLAHPSVASVQEDATAAPL